jgi:integrase
METTTVDEFLMMKRNPITKSNYRSWLKTCFEILGVPPEKYFTEGRKYHLDVITICDTLQKTGIKRRNGKIKTYSDGSIRIMINVFKTYCETNGVVYPKGMEKNLNLCSDAVTQDKVPTKEEINKIVSHQEHLYRAPLFIGVSSWLRLEDIFGLKISQLKLDKKPARFRYYCYKIKKEHMLGFLTNEAAQEIREYLKVRESHLQKLFKEHKRVNKYQGTYEDFLNESPNQFDVKRTPRKELLFPYNHQVFTRKFNEACESAGLGEKDSTTGRQKIHFHTLRKYGDTLAPSYGMHQTHIDFALSHTNGLQRIYNRLRDEQFEEECATEWLKVESLVTLSYNDSTKEMANKEMKEVMDKQTSKIDMIEQQLKMMTSKFAEEYIRNFGSIEDVPKVYLEYKKFIQENIDRADRSEATPEQIRIFEKAMKKLLS